MNRIIQLVFLILVVMNCRGQSNTKIDDFGLMSVTDELSQQTHQVEKFALQFWYLIKIGDLEKAEEFVQNPEHLKTLFKRLGEPVNYSWKLIRSFDKKAKKRIIDIFVSYPRYYGDPERKPFLQIRCVIGANSSRYKFENVISLYDRKIDIYKFNEGGIFPAHLTLPHLYLIKNRTARTVLDSLSFERKSDNLFILSRHILDKLENNDLIKLEDLVSLTKNFVSSEDTFFPIKLFGDHYNRYVLSGKKMFDNSIEESNYFLRDAILECIDSKIRMSSNFVPFKYVSGDSCAPTVSSDKLEIIFSEAEENLISANTAYAIHLLLKSNLPQEIKKELEVFCGAKHWVESRYEEVKKGEESYIKLSALNSIMTRRMLDIMSEFEQK